MRLALPVRLSILFILIFGFQVLFHVRTIMHSIYRVLPSQNPLLCQMKSNPAEGYSLLDKMRDGRYSENHLLPV
jgi:hypothetical protein